MNKIDYPEKLYVIFAIDSVNIAAEPDAMLNCLRDLCKRLSKADFRKTQIFVYNRQSDSLPILTNYFD